MGEAARARAARGGTRERVWAARLVTAGMAVYDAFDRRLGRVAGLQEAAAEGVNRAEVASDSVVEVRTGLLGLGTRLFIPWKAVSGISEGKVFIATTRHEIYRHGWDRPPGETGEGAPDVDEGPAVDRRRVAA